MLDPSGGHIADYETHPRGIGGNVQLLDGLIVLAGSLGHQRGTADVAIEQHTVSVVGSRGELDCVLIGSLLEPELLDARYPVVDGVALQKAQGESGAAGRFLRRLRK